MNVSALRHQITLQSPVETTDDMGAITTTWTDVEKMWAAVDPLTMREAFNLHVTFAEATHKVTIRYLAGVTPKFRILFGERIFNINSIINVAERNEQLILTCSEKL